MTNEGDENDDDEWEHAELDALPEFSVEEYLFKELMAKLRQRVRWFFAGFKIRRKNEE